jgi:hypothetical protein
LKALAFEKKLLSFIKKLTARAGHKKILSDPDSIISVSLKQAFFQIDPAVSCVPEFCLPKAYKDVLQLEKDRSVSPEYHVNTES